MTDRTLEGSAPTMRDRIRAEARGMDLHVTEAGRFPPHEFWLSTSGLDQFYDVCLDLLGDVSGKTILDCGCGPGHTSVMLAKRGAHVKAFDPSQESILIAEAVQEQNGTGVEFSRQFMETADYPAGAFDLVFGSCVIHHTDTEQTAGQLSRWLKPGGRAVFIENSNRNPLLMLARDKLPGRFGIPKWSDEDDEHPLQDDEIARMREIFDGEIITHHPALVFFRLLDLYVLRRRIGPATALLRLLDRGFGAIPGVARLGYFQILEFRRAGS